MDPSPVPEFDPTKPYTVVDASPPSNVPRLAYSVGLVLGVALLALAVWFFLPLLAHRLGYLAKRMRDGYRGE